MIDKLSDRKIFKVKLFHKDLYFVNHPDLIHKVLNSEVCLEKPRMFYKFLGLNDGLLCCKYSQWRNDRRNFSCSFNQVMVRAFMPIFSEIADRMIEKLKSHGGKEVNIIHYTERCTISMILASSFNVFPDDIEDTEERVNDVAEATKITSILLSQRFRKILWFFDVIFHRTSTYRKQMELRNFLYKTLFQITNNKSENAQERDEKNLNFIQNIFFNRLMAHKGEMTDEMVNDSIATVVGAGFETTGTASAHCILFLAMHPEIQEKAYQEIMSVFPTDDIEITSESLAKLEFIECVMKESLRLGPTVHAIARENMENFEITPGKIIKKGSLLVVNIYGLHHRKDLWGDDAEEFNPDRFLAENFEGKEKFFIPFSVGKRNCIGYRYAYASFKIMLVKLLKNFKFTTNLKLDELRFNRQIALKLYGKHSVMIEMRNV